MCAYLPFRIIILDSFDFFMSLPVIILLHEWDHVVFPKLLLWYKEGKDFCSIRAESLGSFTFGFIPLQENNYRGTETKYFISVNNVAHCNSCVYFLFSLKNVNLNERINAYVCFIENMVQDKLKRHL